MATAGHESEAINVSGLKASFQKYKTKISDKKYVKPSGGIPKTDLASDVQTSLGKADSAIQSHQTIKQDGVTGASINRFCSCSTAAATAAKSASITTGTLSLEAGVSVRVKFTNANTASTPTLNINSTGAKNIFHKGVQITTGDNKGLLAGVCDFVYDGNQWHLVGSYIDTNTQTVSSVVGQTGAVTASQIGTALTNNGYKLTDTTYSAATTSANGLMSSGDKTKLNGIESGAQTHKAPTTSEVKSALGTGSGTSKYLREDGTWVTPPNTTYSVATTSANGLMSSSDKTKINGIESGAQVHKAPTTAEVKNALGTGSGTSKYLREDGTWQTPQSTTYESKAAVSGGTDVSLCTTGEKYIWNNKGTYSKPSGGIPKTDLASAVQTTIDNALVKTTQTLTTAEKDQVATNLNNRPNTNGMARIELKATDKFKTVVEAQTGGNATFVIKYDFTLTGNVTIPTNCILQFDGGRVIGATNCTLTLNGCYLLGKPRFSNVVFNGNIGNGFFDATWIDNGNDIGAKINYAQTYFKSISTPRANYQLSTPVLMTGMSAVDLQSEFEYVGSVTNGGAAINIEKSGNANIYVHSLYIDSSNANINYTNSRTKNFIGLAITSCNGCTIKFDGIVNFNENIRMQDIYALGCSYNRLFGNYLANGNANIRFYQHNSSSGAESWCNQALIEVNRITSFSISKPRGDSYGVVIGGPALDLPSYKNSSVTDSQDGSSNITIRNTSMEEAWNMVYARNILSLYIDRCREEAAIGLVKCSGSVSVEYKRGYTTPPVLLDVSENLSDGKITPCVTNSFKFDLKGTFSANSQILYPKDCIFCRPTLDGTALQVNINESVYEWYGSSSYQLSIGYIIDTSQLKFMWFNKNLYVTYLNDAGTAVIDNLSNYPLPAKGSSWFSPYLLYSDCRYVKVPSGVKKIFVAGDFNIATAGFEIYSETGFTPIIRKYNTYGTTAERPVGINRGDTYHDVTLNKLLVCNNGVWKDAAGNNV